MNWKMNCNILVRDSFIRGIKTRLIKFSFFASKITTSLDILLRVQLDI